jgi:hypothetical protein
MWSIPPLRVVARLFCKRPFAVAPAVEVPVTVRSSAPAYTAAAKAVPGLAFVVPSDPDPDTTTDPSRTETAPRNCDVPDAPPFAAVNVSVPVPTFPRWEKSLFMLMAVLIVLDAPPKPTTAVEPPAAVAPVAPWI